MWAKTKKPPSGNNHRRGFTIVELLIVIVVIGVLAAIVIVAYNGVQSRARDAKRVSDLGTTYKALLSYSVDSSLMPGCAGFWYCVSTPTKPPSTGDYARLSDSLKPTYMSANVPIDPINTDNAYGYYYAKGYVKNASGVGATYTGDTSRFILATRLESNSNPTFTLFGNNSLNYIIGN